MAFPTVQSAVAKVVMDAKLKVFDDLVTFLDAKIEIDDELKVALAAFKDSLKESEEKAVKAAGKKSKKNASDGETEKKKRAPSLFNLFVKDKMPELKAQHPDVKDGKLMIGFASEAWKTDPLALFVKEKAPELKKDDSDDSDNETLYAKLKTMFTGVAPPQAETANESDSDDDVVEEKKTKKAPKKGTKKASE
jgi:hypothetical protein